MAKTTICNKCGKTFDMWDDQNGFGLERDLVMVPSTMVTSLNWICAVNVWTS